MCSPTNVFPHKSMQGYVSACAYTVDNTFYREHILYICMVMGLHVRIINVDYVHVCGLLRACVLGWVRAGAAGAAGQGADA